MRKILSPYVHYFETDKHKYIVLDTYNGKIYRVDSTDGEKFRGAMEHPENVDDNHILVKMGIICEKASIQNHRSLHEEFISKKDYLHLVILPTEDCNFRCPYCYEEHRKSVINRETINSIYKYIEKELKK